MRILPILLFLLSINLLPVYGQGNSFGSVSIEDFNITFPDEEDAPAIILHELGESKFVLEDAGFNIHFTKTIRIKINSKEALSLGEVSIRILKDGYNRTEYVQEIEGYTYNIDNGEIKRTPLGVDQIIEVNESDKWDLKKFALPSVRENSIIEYTYKLITPFIFNLPDWEFQNTVPTIYSSYKVALNPFYEYSYRLQGAARFDYHNSEVNRGIERRFGSISYYDMIHTYVMKNIPSFKDESFITTRDDYILKLDFQLAKINNPSGGSRDIMTTWEEMNETFLKEEGFGKFLNQASRQVDELVEMAPVGKGRAKWLIDYIRENYSWNGYYHYLANDKAKDFAKTRSGNSAEVNLFLIAALNEAGIKADPVLISTRNHGKIHSNYPFADQFNNVIVLVDSPDGLYLTDGTEEYLPYNTIPPNCINDQGLIVRKNDSKFVALSGFTNSKEIYNISWDLDPANGLMRGDVLYKAEGYDAYGFRKRINNDFETFRKEAESNGLNGVKEMEFTDNGNSRIAVKYDGTTDIEFLGENLLVAPFADVPFNENPLKNMKRQFPVDLTYSYQMIYTSQIKLPSAYQLEDIPESYSADNDLVNLNYSCKILGDHIVTHAEVSFKKSVYPTKDYERLRNYFVKMVDIFNQQLILVKKGS